MRTLTPKATSISENENAGLDVRLDLLRSSLATNYSP